MKFHSLLEAVAHWAEHTPDKTCLIDADGGRQITYGELWRAVRVFARRLRNMGLQKGDRVVVRVGSVIETLAAQFGVYLAGGVYCPVEKHMKELKLLAMLNYFDAGVVVSSERIKFNGNWLDLLAVCDGGEPSDDFDLPNPDDMCAIIFTTGTTGKAKGVMIKHLMSSLFASAYREAYGIDDTDIYMWTQPLDRAGGIRAFAPAFHLGATTVYYSGFVFAKDFFSVIEKYGISVINLQPFAVNIILENAAEEFLKYAGQIKKMMIGGSTLSEMNKIYLRELLPHTNLFLHYNSTEIAPIAYSEFSTSTSNCVGKPFSCTRVQIVDSDGNVMKHTSKDNFGIIECNNAGVMLGYWKDSDLTAKFLRGNWITTTDAGYIDQNGLLYLLGRRDDIIVSGGHKIAPYEIEEIAMLMPGILECACVPVENKILGHVPALFVTMKHGEEFSAKEIMNYLSERLETFKLPRMIRQIEALPKTNSYQKIDKRTLMHYV